MIFDPYRRQFFTTLRRQIWQIFDPSPLENANVLNGWSLMQFLVFLNIGQLLRNDSEVVN